LETYTLRVEIVTPTFIGSGRGLSKKEWVLIPSQNRGLIPNSYRLYDYLAKSGHADAFEEFLLTDKYRGGLREFLLDRQIPAADYERFTQYSVSTGDVYNDPENTHGLKEIRTFVKDPYVKPYIPGSSVKGALRTALLGSAILRSPGDYADFKRDMSAERYERRSSYMHRAALGVEATAFAKLAYGEKARNAVRDILRGLRVGDSRPLSTDDLVLARKIDVTLKGREKPINMLRECLKPGTIAELPVTIDTQMLPYSPGEIMDAVNAFTRNYRESFQTAFGGASYGEDIIYLGGGAGYATKTVAYPLFGKAEGVKIVSEILRNTGPRNDAHSHAKDVEIGASPHVSKMTEYGGTLREIGACRLSFERGCDNV
jgi:CRISPR-associated protein Csm5